MAILHTLTDFILHLDTHLQSFVGTYGGWTYGLLFVIIFCETGLVITPFLPGDSLLFAAGAIAALGDINVWIIVLLLTAAAILGDTVNYWVGAKLGQRLLERHHRWLKESYLERTNRFYEKHGGKTIILARFVPIVRTFAPFVAGLGAMTYRRFFLFNVVGGVFWVGLFTLGGYFFGNIQAVKENFSIVIIAIVIVSLLPAVVEYMRHRYASRAGQNHPSG